MSTVVTGSFTPSSVSYLQEISAGSGQFKIADGYPADILVNVNEYVVITFTQIDPNDSKQYSTHVLGIITWAVEPYPFSDLIERHRNTITKINGLVYSFDDYDTISYVWRKYKMVATPLSMTLT